MKRSILCTVAAFSLMIGSVFAQNATKQSPGAAPAAGGETGEQKLPPGGAPKGAPGAGKMPGAAEAPATPGMKPRAGEAEPPNGQRPQAQKAGEQPSSKAGQPETGERKEPGQKGGTEQRPPEQQKAGEAKPGQAGAARASRNVRSAPQLSTEQATRVRTAFRGVNVRPVHVDFRVNVGVAVPRTVVIDPIPPEIVTIVPEYEGFRYFVVPGQIVIVDPDTFEIVYVLPL